MYFPSKRKSFFYLTQDKHAKELSNREGLFSTSSFGGRVGDG